MYFLQKQLQCNNVTFKVENSQNRSYVTTTIIQFDFYHNISSSPAPILSLRFLFNLCTWFFLILYTQLLTFYAIKLAEHLYRSQKNILLQYFSANLKKCQFHQEEIWFLGYVLFSENIHIEDKKIEAIKEWLEPQSIQDIQVFLRFANIYRQFIPGFS